MAARRHKGDVGQHEDDSDAAQHEDGGDAAQHKGDGDAAQQEDDEDLDEDGGGAQRRARPRRPPNTSNRSIQMKPNRSQLHTPGPIALIPCRNQASNMEDSPDYFVFLEGNSTSEKRN